MKRAIALIAYARFDYFERVLASLLAQQVQAASLTDRYDIHIFQDGLWGREGIETRTGHWKVAEALEALGPTVTVHRQMENLGVARHFDFIERHLFNEKDYDVAFMFEDDLVLAPGYMDAMHQMADRFVDDDRVGMFSAHPGNVTATLEEQRSMLGHYVPMDHFCGYGITRRFWLRRQAFVNLYLKWCEAFPYRERPAEDMRRWLGEAGFKSRTTSQDFVKCCATAGLGAVRIATSANFGLPIGEVGLHSRPDHFRKLGLDRAVIYPEPLDTVPELSEADFRSLLQRQTDLTVKDPSTFDPARLQQRIASG